MRSGRIIAGPSSLFCLVTTFFYHDCLHGVGLGPELERFLYFVLFEARVVSVTRQRCGVATCAGMKVEASSNVFLEDLHSTRNLLEDLHSTRNLLEDLHSMQNLLEDLHSTWNLLEDLHSTRNLEATYYVTDTTQASDFYWDRESGLRVNIGILNMHLIPEYRNAAHDGDNKYMLSNPNNSEDKTKFRQIIRNYCRSAVDSRWCVGAGGRTSKLHEGVFQVKFQGS